MGEKGLKNSDGTRSQQNKFHHSLLKGLRVMVVDDSKEWTSLLCTVLVRVGAFVFEANTVRQAWRALNLNEYHVVLCDIGMPEEGGFDLLKKVKESTRDNINGLPVIALTAYRSLEERNEYLRVGFSHHMTKPFGLKELIDVLCQFKLKV